MFCVKGALIFSFIINAVSRANFVPKIKKEWIKMKKEKLHEAILSGIALVFAAGIILYNIISIKAVGSTPKLVLKDTREEKSASIISVSSELFESEDTEENPEENEEQETSDTEQENTEKESAATTASENKKDTSSEVSKQTSSTSSKKESSQAANNSSSKSVSSKNSVPNNSSSKSEPVQIPYKININTASQEWLENLTGIGEVKAQAIIAARPFEKIDDILEVKGIGPATYEKIKDRIVVS